MSAKHKKKVHLAGSHRYIKISSFLVIVLGSSHSWAGTGISMASGYGVAHSIPFRIGAQQEFSKHWCTDSSWLIGGYWEGSFYNLSAHNRNLSSFSHKHVNIGALAAVARLERKQRVQWGWPYLEIGFGASLITHKEFGGRKLGTHFQFEDRIGVGIRFGENREYDVGYKAIHFSNAYIGSYNHGINLHVLMIGYWFN